MGLAWKVMIPLALINLLCAMIVREYSWSPWLMTFSSLGVFLAAAWIGTRMPAPKYAVDPISLAGR